MKKISALVIFSVLMSVFICVSAGFSEELQTIKLPDPQKSGGKPLMDCLNERHSWRGDYSTKKLSMQTISNILWAAHGLNRPYRGDDKDAGCRTNPSGHNVQEVDVYVALQEGLYLYDELSHILKPVCAGDIRPYIGAAIQKFVADAPVGLVYVADLSKMEHSPDWAKQILPYATTMGMVENVYLYCASEGLSTVVRLGIDKKVAAEKMGLRADQMITLQQPIGYEKKD